MAIGKALLLVGGTSAAYQWDYDWSFVTRSWLELRDELNALVFNILPLPVEEAV